MTGRPGLGPRQRRTLLQAIGAGRVTRNPSGTWRRLGTGASGVRLGGNPVGRVPVSPRHLATLVDEQVAFLREDDVWALTEAGQREVAESAT